MGSSTTSSDVRPILIIVFPRGVVIQPIDPVAQIDWTTHDTAEADLRSTNAFEETDDAPRLRLLRPVWRLETDRFQLLRGVRMFESYTCATAAARSATPSLS